MRVDTVRHAHTPPRFLHQASASGTENPHTLTRSRRPQLVAALALGAAGVQIGTRFNATEECVKFGPNFKARMVQAGPTDTVVVMKSFGASSRVLKNRDAQEILAIEQRGGGSEGLKAGRFTLQDILPLAKFDRLREGMAADDADRGIWNCGCVVRLAM
jgi:NAD(P)H-dependent flavin oxidoreductase YrpB (nitropropane dioxygenase family)